MSQTITDLLNEQKVCAFLFTKKIEYWKIVVYLHNIALAERNFVVPDMISFSHNCIVIVSFLMSKMSLFRKQSKDTKLSDVYILQKF